MILEQKIEIQLFSLWEYFAKTDHNSDEPMFFIIVLAILCAILIVYIIVMLFFLIPLSKRIRRNEEELQKQKRTATTDGQRSPVQSNDTTATKRSDLSSFWTESDISIKTINSDDSEIKSSELSSEDKDSGKSSERIVTLFRSDSQDSEAKAPEKDSDKSIQKPTDNTVTDTEAKKHALVSLPDNKVAESLRHSQTQTTPSSPEATRDQNDRITKQSSKVDFRPIDDQEFTLELF